jgi:uncharacterized membrane protein
MSNSKRKEILILIVCLLIGFALRFYTFDHKFLWIDEIHTFNESRDGLKDQLKYYKENPANFHPSQFFILIHQFYPFPKPQRDLRIFPLIFGILSISTSIVLKGYFDGSFASFRRFQDDASMYLFLSDPKSPEEKGIDMPID